LRHIGLVILAVATALASGACTDTPRVIPARGDAPGPERFLKGGTVVFTEDFPGSALGEHWIVNGGDWTVSEGRLRGKVAKNAGVWLKVPIPDGPVRISWTAVSAPKNDGKPFRGDLKIELFASEPKHQTGYVLINGGWENKLDVIARLDEHGKDRLQVEATKVLPNKDHRYVVVREGEQLHYFRDGKLLATYDDPSPLTGKFLGLNNWTTHVAYDDLEIAKLD
jgi:hypothetical protein